MTRALLPALAALALAAGCAREAAEPLPPRRLPLAEFAGAALPRAETDRIDVGEPASRPQLWSGWGPDEASPEGSFAWAAGASSLLRFDVVEPRDRTLELRGWSFPFHDDPPQEVRIVVNGRELGARLMDERPGLSKVPVPAAALRLGENFLELRYRRHDETAGHNPWAAGWSDVVFSDGRRDGAARPSVDPRDGAIDLPARTELVWAIELPPGSFLAWKSLEARGGARLVVRIATEEGDDSREQALAAGPGQLRLTPADGRHRLVSFRLSALGGGGRVRLEGAAIRMPAMARETAPPPAAKAPSPTRPNVIVYVIDTLRADHLGCYGYPLPTSPELDRFASQAIRWREGRAQASWTRPAIATILTGLQPITHGVQETYDKLARGVPLVSEQFRAAGWQTAMFTSNGNVASHFGFNRGWDRFRYFAERRRAPELHVRASEMTPHVIDWLEHRDPSRPFLLVVHTADPHHPYVPEPDLRKRFAPNVRDRRTGTSVDLRSLFGARTPVAEKRRRELVALYDAEIAGNDRSFGRLMEYLDRAGLRGSTAVLVTSDHGEEFYDHGSWEHGFTLYEEQLRVPFVLRLPDGRGAGTVVRSAAAEQIDIAPTILALAGLAAPPGLPGRDLLAEIPDEAAAARPSFAWLRKANRSFAAVARSQWKLVVNERQERGRERTPIELYALGSDPGELTDLSRDRPLRRLWLEGHLAAVWARLRQVGPSEQAKLDPELEANLRALGYL